jgi:hypothetical protein
VQYEECGEGDGARGTDADRSRGSSDRLFT